MRHRHSPAQQPWITEIACEDGCVEIGIPLGMDQDSLSCWLWLRYDEHDPLVVTLAVRAPSKAVVMERTVLRSDLRAALHRSVAYAGLGVGPGVTKGVTMFYLREDGVTMTILVPTDALTRFVEATEELVRTDLAETDAVSRAFGAVLDQAS